MRKFIIAFLLITISISSTFAQDKKVAVVTFFINKQIDVTTFGAPAFLAVTKLNDDPNFNLAPLLKNFHTQFFENYSKNFPFQLYPEDHVVNNADYKAFVPVGIAESGVLQATKYIIPSDGYKIILEFMGHANEKSMLKIFADADGVMDVHIHFKLAKIGFGGMGVVKAVATATIVLFNKNGDKVFSIEEDGKSSGVSPLIAGVPVMTPDKIMPMCESAMDELMSALDKDMPKLIKKANAKL